MKYIDLTHIFTKDMPVFPAMLPRSFANGFGSKRRCFDQKVISGMHVGTHMDSPGHMLIGGKLLSDYPVENFWSGGYYRCPREKVSRGRSHSKRQY